ncbi:hypothetical protein NGM37_06210, partial [Streptomyces sp. TRM76130]|nr:hypothetical protein [Streptomyces sp. TRM76130]
GAPVPRDMPDQQVGPGEDPWDVAPGPAARESGADDARSGDAAEAADVPDTDEAGTGRQGAPHSGAVDQEQPVPDESSG